MNRIDKTNIDQSENTDTPNQSGHRPSVEDRTKDAEGQPGRREPARNQPESPSDSEPEAAENAAGDSPDEERVIPEPKSTDDADARVAESEQNSSQTPITEHPEYKALYEKYIRLYAEFENSRKRLARESLETIASANADLLGKLIPTLENFELAFSPDRKAKKLHDFEEGVRMIYKSFKDVLEEAGLEAIDPEGEEFDPTYQDALMEQHHDTVPGGHVAQVFQKGYKVRNKILKHAKVILSKGKAAESAEQRPDEGGGQ